MLKKFMDWKDETDAGVTEGKRHARKGEGGRYSRQQLLLRM